VFTRSRTLARIGGVPIQVDPTWFLIILLLAWSFWSRFTTGPPTHPAGVALAMAVTATALFALSVLAHELAHALEAKRRGVPVGGITLYLFGGATEILSEEVKGPGDQLALTIAGPWTSLVLGALFGLIAWPSSTFSPGRRWTAAVCSRRWPGRSPATGSEPPALPRGQASSWAP